MSRVDFYHLQKQSLEEVLPKLLEKAYSSGKKTLVKIGSEERVSFLNGALWTYSEQSFLPHGCKKDGNAEFQPIWLTSEDENPNNAELLFLVDGAKSDIHDIERFIRIFNIFDGQSEEAIAEAREFWKKMKNAGHECHYWQQTPTGNWQEK